MKINTLKDHSHLLLHTALVTGTLAFAIMNSGPVAGIAFLGLAAATIGFPLFQASRRLEEGRIYPLPPHAASVSDRISLLARKIGLEHRPNLYLRKSMGPVMYHADAYEDMGNKKRLVISLTEPLIINLEPAEIDSIMAHEIGHLGARHVYKRAAVSMLANATILTTCFSMAAAASPTLPMISVALGLGLIADFTKASYLRGEEFQADRISAEATSPESLKGALRKLEEFDRAAMPSTHSSFLKKLFQPIVSAFNHHPGIDRRCARLDRMIQNPK